ncbi:uncharacterized protein EI90DRAFT_3060962 [Cantharellus anzutake]|uniref:uncharacterized protein n=1 Tax=Cantharellus anzutake TaxID=1750568 RepID=UPI0019035BBC|nr:uncharacterized protein EI90DRAFT_3077812 [Cantharellus anzutake]XP_038915355.1 uncharacterized protein EI90DRAFT_3060962 [Cantharellus anzutake]KAF8322806.1 hypothetical protein EI90DRAFT_3077812 [Cantharellus anzutake]KAF8330176.1 hypothetical protein EI90DRAFT_3060962 [Cantharellus anzutake]
MILDMEKAPPPPPYLRDAELDARLQRTAKYPPTLVGVPPHLLLQIVYWTCPDFTSSEERRASFYWMCYSLRYTCRDLWIACMHILRSSYLPLYARRVNRPFTTDPFPSSSAIGHPLSSSPILSTQRETTILDMFILLKTREDVRTDESSLYLDNADDQYRDLFNLMQPRARVEDLTCKYGLRAGLIAPTPTFFPAPVIPPSPLHTHSNSSQVSLSSSGRILVPFSDLSISWGHRRVGLQLRDTSREPNSLSKRTVLEVERVKGETLESLVQRLVKVWLALARAERRR